MQKLRLSTKFPHQEIRWNYYILRTVNLYIVDLFREINDLEYASFADDTKPDNNAQI